MACPASIIEYNGALYMVGLILFKVIVPSQFCCCASEIFLISQPKHMLFIAPDKDWRQLGIYPPLFGLIGYLKF